MVDQQPAGAASPPAPPRAWTRHVIPLLTAAMGLAAVLAAVELVPTQGRVGLPAATGVFTVLFLLAGLTQLHVEFGRQTWSHTLSELPLTLGLFFCPPAALILARCLGGLLGLLIEGRREPRKIAFNTCMFGCEAAVAIGVQRALLGTGDAGAGVSTWLSSYAAVAAADAFSLLAVMAAIMATAGRIRRDALLPMLGPALVSGFLNATLALIALLALRASFASAGLLAIAALGLALAHRGYSALLRRHDSLRLVNQFTRGVGGVGVEAVAVADVLEQVRTVLGAEVAALDLWHDEGATRTLAGSGGVTRTGLTPDTDWLRTRVRLTGRGCVIARNEKDPELRNWLLAEGVGEAVLAPLPGEEGCAGVLLVGDRAGRTTGFAAEDLTVLETLAAHVAVALANERLVHRLRHDALHDALTGLPNRRLLGQRLAAALEEDATRADGRVSAMALLDLNRFKEVNDTLGHHTGDTLLEDTARRLAAATVGWPCVARLGGDEFAAVLPPVRDETEALLVLAPLVAAFDLPFHLDGVQVEVRASVGVALGGGQTGASLLTRRADLAMYAAKAAGEEVRVFQPGLEAAGPEQLALVTQLRRALERGEIEPFFQPKVEAGSRRVTGFEALARWRHPDRGLVPPDVFVPLAEHTGMIVTLTHQILTASVRECARWQASGQEVGVAVNVSVRALLDPELPTVISRTLRASGLAPEWLTLEITESGVMVEKVRTLAVLRQLADLGVKLSVDDFGTGYSSLSYLQRLPVHEVKIDRSFVQALSAGGPSAAIVRAVVDLGHSLELNVVAEGVEDEVSATHLLALGCDVLQGYLLARPMPAMEAAAWLARHGTRVEEPRQQLRLLVS